MPTYATGIANAWANVGKSAMSGLNAYEKGQTAMAKELAQQALMGAHARAFDSQSELNNEKIADSQQRRQYQTPEFANQIAAGLVGLSDDQGKQITDFQKNGNWGMNPAVADETRQMTLAPTPKAAPEGITPEVIQRFNQARGAHLANLGGTGNTNAEQMVDAVSKLIGQNRIDSAIANPKTAADLGRAMAASKGMALFHQGTNGVMDQFTGAETLNDVGKSAALENRAQAGNASASAALHRAQIPEVQSRIDLNKSKTQAPIILTDKDGNQTVYDPKAKGQGKPPTEFQAKSATYGARAREASDIMDELEGVAGKDAYNRLAAAAGGGDGIVSTVMNPALSESTQRVIQARRDFINAVLRQESGAVISPTEFSNAAKQYFPMPGDTAKTIEQKRRNRETAIKGFNNAAGQAKFDAPQMRNSALSGVPAAAVAHLKANPNLLTAFAAKYGQEAADSALRGQ